MNEFSSQENIDNELKYGFAFVMDYNEDRQVTFGEESTSIKDGLINSVVKTDGVNQALIYLNTIGKLNNIIFLYKNFLKFYFRASKVHWRRRI